MTVGTDADWAAPKTSPRALTIVAGCIATVPVVRSLLTFYSDSVLLSGQRAYLLDQTATSLLTAAVLVALFGVGKLSGRAILWALPLVAADIGITAAFNWRELSETGVSWVGVGNTPDSWLLQAETVATSVVEEFMRWSLLVVVFRMFGRMKTPAWARVVGGTTLGCAFVALTHVYYPSQDLISVTLTSGALYTSAVIATKSPTPALLAHVLYNLAIGHWLELSA